MTQTHYEERLLTELRALVERNAATAPAPRAVRRRKPRLVVAGVAGSACLASAVFASSVAKLSTSSTSGIISWGGSLDRNRRNSVTAAAGSARSW